MRSLRSPIVTLSLLALMSGCFAPAFDPRGKLCTGTCPAPYVCGLTDGGGPSACSDPPSRTNACLEDPAACGFPDSSNVGTPKETSLTVVPDALQSGDGWTWSAGDKEVQVTKVGVTLQALEIHGAVNVQAASVTLQNLLVTATNGNYAVRFGGSATNGLLIDSSIGGVSGSPVGTGLLVIPGNPSVTARRVGVTHAGVGVGADAVDVEDSYVHDIEAASGVSPSGTVSSGHGGTRIHHSTVLMQIPGNCALCLFTDTGSQTNDTFDGNLIDGGGYSIYGGGDTGTSQIIVTHNRIGDGATYGPYAHFAASGSGNVLQGNVHDADGTPIH